MNPATLDQLIRSFADLNQRVSRFIWHGGEPSLAGREFFRHAVGLQRNAFGNRRVINLFQTNGTLLTRTWVDFLIRNGFSVGVSVDGPADVHDANRVNRDGRPTSKTVWRNLSKALAAGLRAGIVIAVTQASIGRAAEILAFFHENGLHSLNFSPVAEPGEAFSLEADEWGQFLVELFDAWIDIDDPNLHIQLFDSLLDALFGLPASLCSVSRSCERYLSVDADGQIFVCGRFMGDAACRVGDIGETSLRDMIQSEAYASIASSMNRVPVECVECRWLLICEAGCAYYRQSGRQHFCASFQVLLEHICDVYRQFGVSLPYEHCGTATAACSDASSVA